MIIEDPNLRDKTRVFKDRKSAGKKLLELLTGKKVDVLLAIPNGGLPVAVPLSKSLPISKFNLLIIKKVPLPTTAEAGFGAVTPDGRLFLNDQMLNRLDFEDQVVEKQVALAKNQIDKRIKQFDLPPIDVKNKHVIVTDDGVASGYSMIAAANWLAEKGALEIIIAVPTAPLRSLQKFEDLVDEILCLNVRTGYRFSVAAAYENWYDVPMNEAKQILSKIKKQRNN